MGDSHMPCKAVIVTALPSFAAQPSGRCCLCPTPGFAPQRFEPRY